MADSSETAKSPRPNITPLLLPKPYFKEAKTVLKSVQAPESPRTSQPPTPTLPNSPCPSEPGTPSTPIPRPRPQLPPKPDMVTIRANSIDKDSASKSSSNHK